MPNKLIEYGIKQEKSNIRAHVCPAAKYVYVYQTKVVQDLIQRQAYREVSVTTNGQTTAKGLLVPLDDIPGLRRVPIADKMWEKMDIQSDQSTSVKGRKAHELVEKLIERDRFPLFNKPISITNLDLQYAGVDLMVVEDKKIQVKCDLKGGDKRHGGSGNLFIQTYESNQYKQY